MMFVNLLVFVDTSAWYALQDANDRWHKAALRFLSTKPRLITTNFFIDETITLLSRTPGARHSFGYGRETVERYVGPNCACLQG
jgi:hypothetical protein